MSTSETSRWIRFFEDCGIPASLAASYATKFVDHRIKKAMLEELTKEHLQYIGISALGDIIAILKRARKHSYDEQGFEAAMAMDTDLGNGKAEPMVVKKAAAAPVKSRLEVTKRAADSLGSDKTEFKPLFMETANAKGKSDSKKLPSSCGESLIDCSSVFQRLGEPAAQAKSDGDLRVTINVKKQPAVAVSGSAMASLKPSSKKLSAAAATDASVFTRLGGATKRTAAIPMDDDDDDDDYDVSPVVSPKITRIIHDPPRMMVSLSARAKTVGVLRGGVAKPKASTAGVLRSGLASAAKSVKSRLGLQTALTKPIVQRTVPKSNSTGVLLMVRKAAMDAVEDHQEEPVSPPPRAVPIKRTLKATRTKSAPGGVFSRLGMKD